MTSRASSDNAAKSVSGDRPVVVLANMQSGRGKWKDLVHGVEARFRQRGFAVTVCKTSGAQDLALLAREAISCGTKLLFALGGDGTLQILVNATYGRDVVLGIVPAGGGNDFARALCLPSNPIRALEAALRGAPRTVDLVRVSTGNGATRLYLGGGGTGLDSSAALIANGIFKNWPGRWRYVASAIRAYAKHKPQLVRITFDSCGEVLSRPSTIASVLNTPTFGAGIKLAPDARIDDGFLEFAFLERLGFGELLRVLPRLALHGTLDLPRLIRKKVRKVRIESETPVYFQGDGELIGPTPVEIEVVPKAMRFLAPRIAGN